MDYYDHFISCLYSHSLIIYTRGSLGTELNSWLEIAVNHNRDQVSKQGPVFENLRQQTKLFL